jgi:hypothetical protein
MAQQHSQPYQAQTQFGQQLQQQPLAGAIGQRFQASVPQEVQAAVMDLERLETVCEWTKSRATERGLVRVAERADDIANIAHLEKKLLLRGSPFAEPIGRAVQETIRQGVQELQQHVSDPEVQEAISQARQSLGSIEQALGRLQQFGQQPSVSQQGMTQVPPQQEMTQVPPQQGTAQPETSQSQPQY